MLNEAVPHTRSAWTWIFLHHLNTVCHHILARWLPHCGSLFNPLASPRLVLHYDLWFFSLSLLSLGISVWAVVAWLSVRRPLQLLGPSVQAEQSGDLTQDGVVLLEARNPLVEGGLVSPAGHTHGINWTLIHWIQDIQELRYTILTFPVLLYSWTRWKLTNNWYEQRTITLSLTASV